VAAVEPLGAPAEILPETQAVYWRPRMDAERLRRRGWGWTAATLAHTVPFCLVAVLLLVLEPLSLPVALIALAHAWAIPELYAKRGANVLRPPRQAPGAVALDAGAERLAAGLLGDLVSHADRDLFAASGLVTEPGRLGVWAVGQAGAVLVRPGARRADCWCVRVEDPSLPAGDRVAHLLLALREDEAGFATVANLAFSGAPWRVRRRLPPALRPGLDAAVARARPGADVPSAAS
jgi:hypothetical protein